MLDVERMIFTMDFSNRCDGRADRSAGNSAIVPAAFRARQVCRFKGLADYENIC
jgi:hypothetical protein